jgi:hypothetical protein
MSATVPLTPVAPPKPPAAPSKKSKKKSKVTKAATGALPPTGHPSSSNPIPAIGSLPLGTTAIQISPSDPTSFNSIATLQQTNHPRVYTLQHETRWQGKRYILTLEVPLAKDQSQMNQTELNQAAQAFAEVFLEDLKQRLEGSAIKPGQDFKVLFDDEGYVAFKDEKKKFDPTTSARADILDPSSGLPNVATTSTDTRAVELSKTISLGDPQKIKEALAKPELKSAATESQPAVSSSTFEPVGLVNQTARCFFNTAFQQWINNRVIRHELLNHPEYFVNGATNPLYLAMKGYVEHQKSGKKEPYDFGNLLADLNIDEAWQEDIDVAFRALECQLDFQKIPSDSALYSKTKRSFQVHGDQTWYDATQEPAALGLKYVIPSQGSLTDWLKAGAESQSSDQVVMTEPNRPYTGKTRTREKEIFEKAPDVLTVYVKRAKPSTKDCKPETKHSLIDKLRESSAQQHLLAQLFGNHLTTFDNLNIDNRQKETLADLILSDTHRWALVAKCLKSTDYNEICRQIPIEKDTTPANLRALEQTLPKEVCGEEAQYELMSYGVHLGDKAGFGHWISYIRDQKGFWKISDDKIKECITEQEFLNNAQIASSYIFNRKGITSQTEVDLSKENRQIKEIKLVDPTKKLTVEEGSLLKAGEDFTLINPTNELLTSVNPQIQEEVELDKYYQQISAHRNKIADERRSFDKFFYGRKVEYSEGDVVQIPHQGKSQQTLNVLHVVTGTHLHAVKESLKKALYKAAKLNLTQIAIPLIQVKGQSPKAVYDATLKAVQEFIQEKKAQAHSISKLKIILTSEEKKAIFDNTQAKPATSPTTTTSAPAAKPLPAPSLPKPAPQRPVALPSPQEIFLNALTDSQSQTIPHAKIEGIDLYLTTTKDLDFPKANHKTALSAEEETVLMNKIAAKSGSGKELIIDCRGASSVNPLCAALDYRNFGSDPQRLFNFIAHLIKTHNIKKPIRLILPPNIQLPKETKDLTTFMETKVWGWYYNIRPSSKPLLTA